MLELRDFQLDPANDAPEINHEFSEGQISVVLGRNASGKTRLCRLIAGLDNTPGSIVLDGEDISSLNPRKRSVALVYQAFVNYPNFSVYENLASPLVAQGVKRAQIDDRVRELAFQLELEPLLERLPDSLSGGQQQRVAIGRALAQSARVLLLDEPLVNLDYKLREALEFRLRELLISSRVTVIYTTSDPKDAFSLGDEVLLLDNHQLLQSGKPLDIYRKPTSFAAANLMSDPGVNVWRGRAVPEYVRPEHLSLTAKGNEVAEYPVTVTGLETNGSETFVHARALNEHWVAKVAGLKTVAVGEKISFFTANDNVLRFEKRRGGKDSRGDKESCG